MPAPVHVPRRSTVIRRAARVLSYEPTWIPEWSSSLGILVWSVCVFLTHRIEVHGTAWMMPAFGLVFGPLRWVLLARLSYPPRVAAAAGGAVWWGYLLVALIFTVPVGASHIRGLTPSDGALIVPLALDMMTLLKFSFFCLYADEQGEDLAHRRRDDEQGPRPVR